MSDSDPNRTLGLALNPTYFRAMHAMNLALHVIMIIAIACVGVAVLDWVFVGRLAAYYTDFDYRYWPLSKPRLISVFVTMFAVAAFGIYLEWGGDAPWWLASSAVELAVVPWLVIGLLDVNAQRRIGYQEPPRYSDSD